MDLKQAYDICKKKVETHMKHFPEVPHDIAGTYNGDYYSAQKDETYLEIPFFEHGCWMTSFVTGMAPLMFRTEKDEAYIKWANSYRQFYHDKVTKHAMNTMHDLGFLYSPYSVAMYQLTGAQEHKEDALLAANELAKRFQINGGFIDSWNRLEEPGPVRRAIIDTLVNLPLLFWAWKETGHYFYHDVACAHLKTVEKVFVREDLSVAHSFEFNRVTGELLCESNACGYENGSYWARGAAWAVLGFAIAGRYLEDESYFDLAEKLAENFIQQKMVDDVIPIWDFRLPADMPAYKSDQNIKAFWDETKEENCRYNVDTSAAAVMCCGILELSKNRKNAKLITYVEQVLKCLSTEEYLNTDPTVAGLLKKQNGRMVYMTFGDYFYMEALQRYLYDTELCW